jgi:DNA-directed RNA polymerase subunit RPC12/RpoP
MQKVALEVQKEILNIELDWIEIIKTKANYWWFRMWFKCPKCSNKVFTLYNINSELVCRKCSWLNYKKQRFKWMLEEKLFKN